MEIEKTMTVAAPAAQVWQMLLDPQVMGSCVPGMKSIEVVSEVEYIAQIHVKISFISAKFKLRTTIVEQQAPRYLRCEGTGEDASVASSLKQQSELFLTELPDGRTELRMKVKVDVLGRLGTFGLSVMKTKADRMWEEFGQNLVARLEGGPSVAATTPARAPAAPIQPAAPAPLAAAARPVAAVVAPAAAPVATTPAAVPAAPASAGRGWWSRLVNGSTADGRHIRIELQRGDTLLKVDWPVEAAADCSAWLREVTK
ncbi:CoxG family protein [Variovorax saccharolyticus]|uniref:CoxG family protein n=1 Tax=Variovorax saccharolyticus TaxID=3053516 RepID=UPI002574B28C|nr:MULTISPECIES: SRPBCC family protein [unclassified Variovorax]MDM0019615.1 SRPBCC family protein [Variovorax sp. J22R187]MDM0027755.1 SRPBCC family protein [Variovorax sp. J31P216]